ncbi:hypothetical protein B0T19DRAFT_438827 [Cercophora scortea]|uniref:Uncharacterized protein n=1 Tax=Cercophora scortea TaxID=314031 RepID=A0AAE0IV79_9PEZI|nr:hypothetical protein B0T19DRAFT_438827 [Cercophora scortea]
MNYLKSLLPIPIGARSTNSNAVNKIKNPSSGMEAMDQKIRDMERWIDGLNIAMPDPPVGYTFEEAKLDLENGVNPVLLEAALDSSSGTIDGDKSAPGSGKAKSSDSSSSGTLSSATIDGEKSVPGSSKADSSGSSSSGTLSSATIDGEKSSPDSSRTLSSGPSSSGTLSLGTIDGQKLAPGSAKTSNASSSPGNSSETVSSGTVDGGKAAPGSSKTGSPGSSSSGTLSSATLGFSPRSHSARRAVLLDRMCKPSGRITEKQQEQDQPGKSAGSAKEDSQALKTPSPAEGWGATRKQGAAAQAAAGTVAGATGTAPDDEAGRARCDTGARITPSTRTRTRKSPTGFHRKSRRADTQAGDDGDDDDDDDDAEHLRSLLREPERMSHVLTIWSIFYILYALIDARDRALRNNWSTGTSYYDVSSGMHCAMIFSSVTQVVLVALAMLWLVQKASPTPGLERLDRLDRWLASMVWW